jgi:aminoglycoside phosphotransferase (APT) family kinase protein
VVPGDRNRDAPRWRLENHWPVHRDTITADAAARLVAGQFPQWAGLPVVPVKLNGWDNTTFRLGDELSVRLPSADRYTAQIAKEHRWLPVLAPGLPLPIPVPVAMGRPSGEFPRPWSVYRWIAGEPASAEQVADPAGFASSLAGFLAALQAIEADDGPPAGAHNFFRGGPLATYDQQTRQLIRLTAGDIDTSAATKVWDAALASTWERPPVWVHGDVTGSNLLVADGVLHAVIDFGGLAVGDPACDLVMEWTFFTSDSAAAFRRGLHLDEATWARGRGWALWKALLMIDDEREGRRGHDAARRFGWRHSPRQIVDLVIADHARRDAR